MLHAQNGKIVQTLSLKRSDSADDLAGQPLRAFSFIMAERVRIHWLCFGF